MIRSTTDMIVFVVIEQKHISYANNLKRNRNFNENKPLQLKETICALLNTKGGFIYMGINSFGKVVGIHAEDITAIQKRIFMISCQLFPNPNIGKVRILVECQ